VKNYILENLIMLKFFKMLEDEKEYDIIDIMKKNKYTVITTNMYHNEKNENNQLPEEKKDFPILK